MGLNPLKRVSGILIILQVHFYAIMAVFLSQSPQTGQWYSNSGLDRSVDRMDWSQSPQTGQWYSNRCLVY